MSRCNIKTGLTQMIQTFCLFYDCHHQWTLDKNNVTGCNEFKKSRNLCQFQLRQMKPAWWRENEQELQDATDRSDLKSFYQNLRDIFVPVSNDSTPIFSSGGRDLLTLGRTFLKSSKHRVECYRESYQQTTTEGYS